MGVEAQRLLLSRQNPDGGWGFRAGQSSWLEPTAYAALALAGSDAGHRALDLLRAWQNSDGSWMSCPKVPQPGWATSLVLILKCARGEFDGSWRRGVQWLVRTEAKRTGTQSWLDRLLRREAVNVLDANLTAWPWTPGTAAWIEPTVHAVRALELSLPNHGGEQLRERIGLGKRMILDRQCRDGGWNYGNKRVLGEDLESFPECTALALIGLCRSKGPQVERGIQCALGHWRRRPRGLAQALLRVAFRMHGVPFDDRLLEANERTETTVLALGLIGEPGGAWRLWRGSA